jgi:hypothetical protein
MVRKKFSRKEIALWGLASLATVLTLTFYLWHINENVRLGYQIVRSESRRAELMDDIKTLRTRRAELRAPDRVEKIARGELGMTDTREDQIIYRAP